MRIYTRTGDTGTTSLFGGTRVPKTEPRVAAYGELDEANSVIGWAAACETLPADVKEKLLEVMSDLLDAGSELATPADEKAQGLLASALKSRVSEERVAEIEKWIDGADAELAPLTQFVLPTGCEAAARLHVARAAVRRAERAIAAVPGTRTALSGYVNRLSDLLFTLARLCNRRAGVPDAAWKGRK